VFEFSQSHSLSLQHSPVYKLDRMETALLVCFPSSEPSSIEAGPNFESQQPLS